MTGGRLGIHRFTTHYVLAKKAAMVLVVIRLPEVEFLIPLTDQKDVWYCICHRRKGHKL